MCYVDAQDGAAEAYGRVERQARKGHRCGECRRTIQPGERYWYHHGVFDGTGFSFKSCRRCEAARRALEKEVSPMGWLVPFGALRCCLQERMFDRAADRRAARLVSAT